MKPCTLNRRWEIILPEHRAARPEWYTEEGWEKKRLEHMHDHISERDTVFYVGAEEGDMCGVIAQWGPEMVLFEPNERVWTNIKAIWQSNFLDPPWLFKGFAANKTTSLDMQLGFNGISGPLISDHGFKELRDPGEIPMVKIDDLPITPTVISMDVEGSEWEVLRGAEQTLRDHHPKIYLSLHPEFLHEQYGEWGAELRRWLMDLGYKETLIDYPLHEVHLYYE